MTEKEELALLLWNCGALRLCEGALPLCWDNEKALEEPARGRILDALEALARDHYAAAEAVLGDDLWAELLAARLGLPLNPAEVPAMPLAVEAAVADGEALLRRTSPLRESGRSIAAAVIFQFGLESARQKLDRADVRLHWLTDLETAAAVALQQGIVDFEDYDRLLSMPEIMF